MSTPHDAVQPLIEPIVFLAAAVVAVPLAKRLGLGSVLGYLAAGVAVGPFALGLLGEAEAVRGVAELGVVLLLFVIGLELNLSRLWEMRRSIFGLGTAQVLVSGAVITMYPYFVAGRELTAAIVAGLGLALSSTALAMQLLEERGELEAPHGRTAFAVLLLQDLAIVPLLALVAFLSPQAQAGTGSPWLVVLTVLGAVGAVVVTGRYLLNPVFRVLTRFGTTETMTAAALLVVLGAAALMALAGLSMAMGAFLAGVLLAESNYRHELEADIEPFRGLLLGLFFVSVGMSVDLGLVLSNWAALLAAVSVLVVTKTTVLYGLARLFGHDHDTALRTGLTLAQGGEFGFVLYSAAAAAGVMAPDHANLLVALVTLSMALTPLTVRLGQTLLCGDRRPEPEEDFSDARGSVLVVGFGRFGQLASQVFLARGLRLTIIDNDVEMIEAAARFGSRVYYGDGTRLDVLRAAGAGRARLIAVCTDGVATTNKVVDVVREAFPDTPCFARSYDRRHSLELIRRGVTAEVRETLGSALAFGREVLVGLGATRDEAERFVADVERRDRERLEAQLEGGLYAGMEHLRVRPEPLTPPAAPLPKRAAEGAPAASGD
ncbi:MAG: Inner membrane protein, KefB/KefC family [uncultured Acetobacteraceae bacterium]|uniref:Inner membrane protein, KefB/KefC family n=1 Tax=uncultured Acetobacteraceae bacterium TaxID=169975 RepID=A0A6J4J5N2_9PROT|nr:MAG: Inner membrane protein, KefB/KefC family [uncultured Acetobacteraceae bacterium]